MKNLKNIVHNLLRLCFDINMVWMGKFCGEKFMKTMEKEAKIVLALIEALDC